MSDPAPLPNWKTDVHELRPFSEIQLIVMDLDNTYVTSGSSKAREIKPLLRKLRHRGVGITLATGRALNSVKEIAEGLEISKPMILYNGSIVVDAKSRDRIYGRSIPTESLRSILKIIKNHSVTLYAYSYNRPKKITDSLPSKREEQVLGWGAVERIDMESNGLEINWQESYELRTNFEPNAIVIDGTEDENALINIQSQLETISEITFMPSKEPYIEIRPLGSNKGTALKFVADELSIPIDQILTIGDNDNDSEMLSQAGIGISVENASEKAFGSSDYYCKHGVTSSVIEVLRLLNNSHRFFDE